MKRYGLRTWLCSSVLAFSVLFVGKAQTMIIRHDVDDQAYVSLGEEYSASVAYLGGNRCASSLIDSHWILTAAHCVKGVEASILTVLHRGNTYRVSALVTHPEYDSGRHDIALVQLSEPAKNGKLAKLYRQEDEKGKSVVFVGRGEFGNGQVGVVGADGKQRGATNTVLDTTEHWIEFQFDKPDVATELEGVSGGGDSGGPAFVTVNSELFVVGVSAFQRLNGFELGTYGVHEVYARVSSYVDWIDDVIDNTQPAEVLGLPPEHPLIDAIKNDDNAQFTQAISAELLQDQAVMNEAFYQTLVLGRISMAKELIQQGADLKSVVINKISLTELAILGEHEDYAEMLVMDFKHLRDIHKEDSKVLPFLVALLGDDFEAFEPIDVLIDQGANIDAQNDRGDTSMTLAVWQTRNLKMVQHLVALGADVNIPNNNGDTPVMDAAYQGKYEILEFLLDSGADVNMENKAGRSALALAIGERNLKAVALLLFHKSKLKLSAITRNIF